jgi:hypothetical protein
MSGSRLWLAAALLTSACASGSYVYRPSEQATATLRGQPAARYALPPDAPRGDIKVASFGVARMELQVDTDNSEQIPTLQVRLVASNESDAPWKIDTRQLAVHIPGEQGRGPAYVNTDQGGLPEVTVPPRGQRTIDAYFPLPESLRGARDVPQFDVSWQVTLPDRVVAQRTPFERFVVEERPYVNSYAGVGFYGSPIWSGPMGWGPVWWYDPLYAPYGIGPRPPVIVRPVPARPLHYGRPPAYYHRR